MTEHEPIVPPQREFNGEQVPLDEIFDRREINRLRFLRHLEQNVVTDVRTPQTPIPKEPPGQPKFRLPTRRDPPSTPPTTGI